MQRERMIESKMLNDSPCKAARSRQRIHRKLERKNRGKRIQKQGREDRGFRVKE